MSLDVSLTMPGKETETPIERIFIREDGARREITREEWNERWPNTEPYTVTQDDGDTVYERNITHNLGKMASEAGIYQHLWRPEELNITRARELAAPLEAGLALLKAHPARFKALNPSNGWGSYEGLVEFVTEYINACCAYPDAEVRTDR